MYKRRIISVVDNKVSYNRKACIKHTVLYQESAVDEFYTEEVVCSDGQKVLHHVDPLIMLFNQERLANLGSMGAKEFLDSLRQQDGVLSELRKKCSDEQLVSMLKSRYLQTPSEIMSYCRYIEGNMDKFDEDMKAYVANSQSQTVEMSADSNVEPVKS